MNSPLKGSFTIFLFLVRSHILNSNGVWYSWFWPEGPKNAQNSIFLGFKFVPRDLDSQRHMGPRLAAQGTLTRGAGDLDSRRHGKLILSWLLSSLIVVSGPCSFFVLSLSTWELEAILEIMPLEMAKIAHFSTATKLKLLQIYQSYFNWAQNHGKFINSCSRMSWVI